MTSHERAVHTIALQAVAHVQNLRNRHIEPEAGWRLVDILGAPQRANLEVAFIKVADIETLRLRCHIHCASLLVKIDVDRLGRDRPLNGTAPSALASEHQVVGV